MNINQIFDKLFDHFGVYTIKELAIKINTPESTVSKWKQRSAISPIKRKCKILGIYDDIFSEIDSSIKSNEYYSINNKLNNLNLKAIICLHFFMIKTNINSYSTYLKYQVTLDEDNFTIFKKFLNEFNYQLKKDMYSFIGAREELDKRLNIYFSPADIDYLFKNKKLFFSTIDLLIDDKRKFI